MANPVGRPTKYSDDLQAQAEEYILSYEDLGELVPTIVGLAIHLDVTTKTIYNWATEEKPEFLRIFTRVEQLQHRTLVNGGLAGTFNPAITKMMMTKHGYDEKAKPDESTNLAAALALIAAKLPG
jgi:hypothetical protein